MRVLVACEFSGIVREAFRARGHDAWSCDLLPTEIPSDFHIQNDVRLFLDADWDLMIAHPPCTYLANSGERWMKDNPDRQRQRREAVEFVLSLWNAPIPKIAIENPIGHLSTSWRKPDQIIQPFQFGHSEWKSTCLWLKNLPALAPTNLVEPDSRVGGGKKPGRISSRIHRLPKGPERPKERSRTYKGIAEAMAEHWSIP
jgi:hypothetical protein